MLPGNEVPFPENQTCKLCIARPCKRLFSGRVYPGKMLFVHHSDFLSWPCHTPVLKPEADDAEGSALTDDLVVTTGKVTVTNPRWEHVDEDRNKESPEKVSVNDNVVLMVDVSGVPEGSPVTFDIFDCSADPPLRIATAKGSNEKGTARGKWTVEDPNEKGEELKLEFEGIAKSKASGRAAINLEIVPVEFKFTLYIDPDNPATYDDKIILKGIDSDYEQTKTIQDDKVKGDGMLTVAFTDVKKGEKYTLVHDDGQERHVIIEETVYGG